MCSRTLTLIATLALLVAACGGGETSSGATEGGGSSSSEGAVTMSEPADEDALTIGSIHPLTGGLALDGTQMDNAVQLAVEDLNASGDLPVQLEVISADTQGEPELGQSEAQRLIESGAATLVGAFQSAVTTNIATVAARQQVPLVIDVAVSDEITSEANDFVFRIQPSAAAMGRYGAEYLVEMAEAAGTEVATVAYMHEQTEFGTSVYEAFAARAEELDIEIVETISYDAFGQSDFTTQVQQATSAGPDIVAVTGYYNDGVTIAQNLADVQPEIAGVYGVANGAFDIPQFPSDAGDASSYIFDSNYHFDATKERVQDIRTRFEERHGEPMRAAAVLSYQAVEVIAEAAKAADDPLDPEALAEAIRGVEVSDPLLTFPGPIQFDETGENVNARPVVMQVLEESIVQVYPSEFQQQEPVLPATAWTSPGE